MIVRVYNFLSKEKPKFSQNLVGIVSDVESFKYTRRAYDIGSFEMVVPTHADEAGCIQPDRMLIVGEKLGQTYIASDPTKRIVKGTFLYVTDIEKKDDKITVTGYDLKYLFALRVTLFPKEEQDKGTYGYYVTSGTTFSCISDIINYNIVNATDSDRQIYGMFSITMPVNQTSADPPLTGIQDDRYMTRLEPVSTAIFNLLKNCKTHFYDMRLIIDDNAEDGDSYNPHMESSEDKPVIIIDESRYNIKSYTRKDGTSAYKNAIYAVVGSGDDVTVKCVKRPNDTASGVKRKEVVLDVDTDSVAEIDRYALKAAEDYNISDDFEIEPLFDDDDTEPALAQKVLIRIDGVDYETVITEITDEYSDGKHTQSYVCGDKKLKVLNVLNKATAGNTQKIINNKIDINNANSVNNAVILTQEDAQILVHNFVQTGYIAGQQIGYNSAPDDIVVQGYVVQKSKTATVRYQSVSLKNVFYDASSDYSDRVIHDTVNFWAFVSVSNQNYGYLSIKNDAGWSYYKSSDAVILNKYREFVGLNMYWTSIEPPSDDYPFGYALVNLHGVYKGQGGDMSTHGEYKLRLPFASTAEYNAAVGLTNSPLELLKLEDYPYIVPESKLVIDSTICKESNNPISNAAVANALDEKATVDHTHSTADITDFPAIPTKVSDLQNDSGYISEETDPTVPAWAKAESKPAYTAEEVGAAAKSHTHTKSEITDFPTLGTAAGKNAADFYPAKAKSVLGLDYNSLTSNGIFEVQGIAENPTTNTPNGAHKNNNFYVQVFVRSATYLTQIATSVRADKTQYIRSLSNGVWNNWEKIKSGDADTVDGKHASDFATAEDISSAVSAVQIGGRNLLLGTREISVIEGTNTADQYLAHHDLACGSIVNLEPGVYTCSADIIGTVEGGTAHMQFYGPPWETIPEMSGNVTVKTTKQKIGGTFTLSSPQTFSATGMRVRTDYVSGTITVSNMKLEKGNKPTDWTPAPEDDERRIASLEARVAALEAAAVSGGEV